MGYWNYRVFKETIGKEVQFSIREAYYDNKKTVPHSWTCEPAAAVGENEKEVKKDLFWMRKAFQYPVIDLDKKRGKR